MEPLIFESIPPNQFSSRPTRTKKSKQVIIDDDSDDDEVYGDDRRKRRKRVKKACPQCRSSHSSCDNQRPCKRCVSLGLECEEGCNAPNKRKKIAKSKTDTKEHPKLGKPAASRPGTEPVPPVVNFSALSQNPDMADKKQPITFPFDLHPRSRSHSETYDQSTSREEAPEVEHRRQFVPAASLTFPTAPPPRHPINSTHQVYYDSMWRNPNAAPNLPPRPIHNVTQAPPPSYFHAQHTHQFIPHNEQPWQPTPALSQYAQTRLRSFAPPHFTPPHTGPDVSPYGYHQYIPHSQQVSYYEHHPQYVDVHAERAEQPFFFSHHHPVHPDPPTHPIYNHQYDPSTATAPDMSSDA